MINVCEIMNALSTEQKKRSIPILTYELQSTISRPNDIQFVQGREHHRARKLAF
jgi:hypothetical protein